MWTNTHRTQFIKQIKFNLPKSCFLCSWHIQYVVSYHHHIWCWLVNRHLVVVVRRWIINVWLTILHKWSIYRGLLKMHILNWLLYLHWIIKLLYFLNWFTSRYLFKKTKWLLYCINIGNHYLVKNAFVILVDLMSLNPALLFYTYIIDMMSSTWIPNYVYITVHDTSEKEK